MFVVVFVVFAVDDIVAAVAFRCFVVVFAVFVVSAVAVVVCFCCR